MTLFKDSVREISVFIYILISLLLFNLYFNLNYNWYGVSLIVRIYLMVFSFYLIFGFASLDIRLIEKNYMETYGKKGRLLLFFEARVYPFLLIYLLTIIFTFIDYIREPNWPWMPIITILNGRYINTIIYSLLLLLILKLRKKPNITVPLFLLFSVLFFIIDKTLYSAADTGLEISAIKIIKVAAFFFLFYYEFFRKFTSAFIFSTAACFFITAAITLTFSSLFSYSDINSYPGKESGLLLLKHGYTFPLSRLKSQIIKSRDYDLLNKLISYSKLYNINIKFSREEWLNLLLNGHVDTAEIISEYMMEDAYDIDYNQLINFAQRMSFGPDENLEKTEKFIKLSAGIIKQNEKIFLNEIQSSNKNFKIWGMAVLGECRSKESIPVLLKYVTDIDRDISDAAYKALVKITGLEPAEKLNKKINDPDALAEFKKYYIDNHSKK